MKKTLMQLIVPTIVLFAQPLLAQFAGGDGTAGNPYQIETAVQLDSIRYLIDKCYILNNDIDLTGYRGGSWVPIDDIATGFIGVLDGNNKKITGLTIDTTGDYQGLFGYMYGAKVKNLGLEGVSISGSNYVGGIGAPGGNCNISNCYVTGSVTGDNYVGGLVRGTTDTDTILNCYSRASVTAVSSFGGLIGYVVGGSYSLISKCYSTGAVSAGGGGFIGDAESGVGTSACFWDTETSGRSTSAGGTGVEGKTTTEMKTTSTFLSAGWSASVWNLGDGINNGYPYLDWQNPSGTPLPVELTSFTAQAIGNSITLYWNTATEVNNYGFEVERRAVNSMRQTVDSWKTIGFVTGAGTSSSTKEYTFVDSKLPSGRYAYRLKQIDNDGAYKYTADVELEVKSAPTIVGLVQNFPNPFNPTTQISFSVSNTEHAKLAIYNLLGQHVKTLFDGIAESEKNYEMKFDASGFASGIYFYRLETPSRTEVRRMQLLK